MPNKCIKRNAHPGESLTEATVKQTVCNLSALLRAEERCHRHVGYKNSVARFHLHQMSRCYELLEDLQNETYRTQRGHEFEIYEPKRRTVSSIKFIDRVPQASFAVNYIYKNIVPKLQGDNFACIKDRGVDKARNSFKELLRGADQDEFCLVADIKSYFGSINHKSLDNMIRMYSDEEWVRNYYMDVINCNGEQDGIGLGSEINQLSATALLDCIDKLFIGKRYKRYMDDFRFIGTKAECESARKVIQGELERLGLRINVKKTYIQPVSRPIKFLGFTYLRHPGGRVTMKRIKQKIRNEKRKLMRMKHKGVPVERILEHCNSVQATLRKGTRSGLCKYLSFVSDNILEGAKYAIHLQT